jgi:hypothetical protein
LGVAVIFGERQHKVWVAKLKKLQFWVIFWHPKFCLTGSFSGQEATEKASPSNKNNPGKLKRNACNFTGLFLFDRDSFFRFPGAKIEAVKQNCGCQNMENI